MIEEQSNDFTTEPISNPVPEQDNPRKEPVVEDHKKKKKKRILLIVAILLLMVIISGTLIILILGKDKKEKTLTKSEQKAIIQEYGQALENVIEDHFYKQDLLLAYEDAILLVKYKNHRIECSKHEIYENAKIYLGDCSIDRVDVPFSYGRKQKEEKIELKEGSIKVYVSKQNNKATLEEPSDKDQYTVYDFDLNEKYSNMFLLSEDDDYVIYYDDQNKGQIYNFKKKEKALSHVEYNYILPIKYNREVDKNYIAVNTGDNMWTFYDLHQGTRTTQDLYVIERNLNQTGYYRRIFFELNAVSDGKIIVAKQEEEYRNDIKITHKYNGLINYRTGEIIIPFNYSNFYDTDSFLYSQNLRIDYNLRTQEVFDYDGNPILEARYDMIIDISKKGYLLVEDNKHLKIVKIDGSEIYTFDRMNAEYYPGKGSINDYKDGLYIQLNNERAFEENIDEKCISIYYNLKTNEMTKKYGYCGSIEIE